MDKGKTFFLYVREIPNFLSIFIYPMFFVIPSVLLMEISSSLGAAPESFNIIFTVYAIGNATGLIISVFLNRKFKKIDIVIYSYIFLILFTFLFIFFKYIFIFFISFFAIGLWSGIIWLQASKYLLENNIKNKDKLMNFALSFHPLGAFFSPYIAYLVINNNLGWEISFYVIIFLMFITLLLYIFIIKLSSRESISEEKDKDGLKGIFIFRTRNIFFILTIMIVLTYFISEGVFITWSPTFLRIYRSLDIRQASMYFSFFYIGMGVGRLLVSIFSGRFKPDYLLVILSFVSITGLSMVNLSTRNALIFSGIIITGLGFSGISPLLFSTGGTIYEKGRGVLATFMFITANLGIALVPLLIRKAVNMDYQHSLMISVLFIILTLLIILSRFYFKRVKKI